MLPPPDEDHPRAGASRGSARPPRAFPAGRGADRRRARGDSRLRRQAERARRHRTWSRRLTSSTSAPPFARTRYGTSRRSTSCSRTLPTAGKASSAFPRSSSEGLRLNVDPSSLTLAGAALRLSAREITASELLEACLRRIADTEPRLHAFLTVSEAEARGQAAAADERFARGEPLSALDGIPIALKDVFLTRGVRTTAASRILGEFRAALRRHRGRSVAQPRRRADRQDELRRVRHGLLDRELRVWPLVQSLGSEPGAGWLLRRLGRRRSGGSMSGGARHRHRRLDSPAGGILRHRRVQTHLRPRQPLRDRRLRFVARPSRPFHPRRA